MKNIIFLVVLSLLIYSSNCKKKNGKKKDEERHSGVENICNEDDRERAIFCSCKPIDVNAAKDAVCWVYRRKISGDDALWDTFASQGNLEKLKFNIRPDGALLNIPTKALRHLKRLQSIEIQYGLINELTPFVFSNLTLITEISIPQNQISDLQPYALANLPNVSVINLDGNVLQEIKRDSIRDMPSLKMLYINRNNLSIIHDYAFEHLHRLEELELNTNQISVVTQETFAGLKVLRYLDLRKNRLTMIGDYTFDVLENLYELVLDQNNIEYLSAKAFSGLKKLRKLRLSENQLKTLQTDVFSESPNVYLLDLRMNGLELVAYDAVQPLWDNFKNSTAHIWLEKNRLKCDCHLSWIRSLRNETQNLEMKLSLEELTCITNEPEAEGGAFTLGTEKPEKAETYHVDVDAVQYDDEDLDYEEDTGSSEYENEPGKPPRKKIFDIPIESLPCPEMQEATTEVAARSSMSYWPEASSSNASPADRLRFHLPLLSIVLVLVLVFLP